MSSDSEQRAACDEAELKDVLLAIAGSDAAFGRLVRAHQGRVRRLLRHVCGTAALADDVAQTVFLKAWRRIGSLRDASRFVPWLRRIALRAAVDAARSAGVAVEPLSDTLPVLEESSAAQADRRLDLETALRQLSIGQRACVLMAYGEGMSHAEIAAELRMQIGTVKSHVARGSASMRRSLNDWRDDHG